ncbi:hypothetical protein EX30DRAFT_344858 [Ascodesmis nigricans]|uniref:Thiamine-binding protein domain-containing protein n=1 Tax=Ascodesmis nigricans TaxID=341454 RepID=A0A4S2MIF6_9PEZI|nr:hypothetical protein EX30DRAFT_344858 [Ascodesmis nigricans]
MATGTTPAACIADFCLIPMGIGSPSVTPYIAEVQKLLEQCEGITFTMHSFGTTVEGSWDAVTKAIGRAHESMHENGVPRVHSSIRIGTRTDKPQTAQDKVDSVRKYLAESEGKSESSAK